MSLPVAEPSKDRDKAVEEARAIEVSERIADALAGRAINPDEVSLGDVMLPLLPIVRAALFNEREAEREENCKAACHFCGNDYGMWEPMPIKHDGDWKHRDKKDQRNLIYCAATTIRNRAARASEEPKPHQMTLIDTCYGVTGGDLYVCPRSQSRTIVRPNAEAPTCKCRASEEGSR